MSSPVYFGAAALLFVAGGLLLHYRAERTRAKHFADRAGRSLADWILMFYPASDLKSQRHVARVLHSIEIVTGFDATQLNPDDPISDLLLTNWYVLDDTLDCIECELCRSFAMRRVDWSKIHTIRDLITYVVNATSQCNNENHPESPPCL